MTPVNSGGHFERNLLRIKLNTFRPKDALVKLEFGKKTLSYAINLLPILGRFHKHMISHSYANTFKLTSNIIAELVISCATFSW